MTRVDPQIEAAAAQRLAGRVEDAQTPGGHREDGVGYVARGNEPVTEPDDPSAKLERRRRGEELRDLHLREI